MNDPAISDNILNMWSVFNEFRCEEKYCDARLQVGTELFRSHRFLLAAASSFFDAMFGGNFREKNVEQVDPIILTDIDPIAFKEILEFIYTGNMTITEANVYNVLRASDFLQLRNPFVEDQCIEFVMNRVQSTNQIMPETFEIFSLAVMMKNENLIDAVTRHICLNLKDFSRNEKFLTMPFDELKLILDRKKKVRCNENGFLSAILRWVDYSREDRRKYRAQLMAKIDFQNISSDCVAFMLDEYEKRLDRVTLMECGDEEDEDRFLAACPVSVRKESLYIYFESFENRKTNGKLATACTSDGCSFLKNYIDMPGTLCVRNIPLNDQHYQLSYDYRDIGKLRKYTFDVRDSNSSIRVNLPLPPVFWPDFDLCGGHNNIYFSGKGSKYTPRPRTQVCDYNIHVFNCDINKWSTLPQMLQKMTNKCMTVHDNIVYVIGANSQAETCGQAYDLRTKTWRFLPPLGCWPRFYYGESCTNKGKIHVIDHTNKYEILVFDPVVEKWSDVVLPARELVCEWSRIASFKDELWLLSQRLDVEIYNDTLDTKWRTLNSLEAVIGSGADLRDVSVF